MNCRMIITILILLESSLLAAPAANTSRFTHSSQSLDAGGGLSASSKFRHIGSLGGIVGYAASSGGVIQSQYGYIAQISLLPEELVQPLTWAQATCRSLVMLPFHGLIQGELNTNYITSFDGSPQRPSTELISHESRPRAGSPGVYEADYLTYNSSGQLWQYGSSHSVMSSADLDGNTLPDIFQLDQSGDTPVTGQTFPDFPVMPGSEMRGRMTRRPGSLRGSYSMTLSNAYGTVSYQGEYRLLYLEFQVAYQRGPSNRLRFDRLLMASERFTNVVGGSTEFTVTNPDQVELAAFTLTTPQGLVYTVRPANLRRVGNKYSGEMEMADGYLSTPWPDYQHWLLELTDLQDANRNGIPDLSDLDLISPDADQDGLPDRWEISHALDPANPNDAAGDPDQDGMSNLREFYSGTNPQDPGSVLKLTIKIQGGQYLLSFDSILGKFYRLERASDLKVLHWDTTSERIAGSGSRVSITESSAWVQPARFGYYRLVVVQ